MNPTNNSKILVPVPYFTKEKIIAEQKVLQRRIDDETSDLKKMVTPNWKTITNSVNKPRIFAFYESTLILLHNRLIQLRSEFDYQVVVLKETRYKFYQFILTSEAFEEYEETRLKNQEVFENKETSSTPAVEQPIVVPIELYLTPAGSAPDYYVLEMQARQCQKSFGSEWGRTNFPQNKLGESEVLSSTFEKECTSSLHQESILGTVSRFKVWLTYFIVFVAMIPEYLIYSAIISSIFEFDGIKSAISGTVVLLLGKVNAIIIWSSVREYLRKHSSVFRLKGFALNRFFLFIFCISFVYCFAIGLLFKSYKDEQKLTKNYVLLQQTVNQIKEEIEFEGSTPELEEQLAENRQQLEKLKTQLFDDDQTDYLKLFTIGFSGAIVLLASSVLFAVAMLFATSYHLRKKVEQTIRRISKTESRFYSQQHFIRLFKTKAFGIYVLNGELEFLRRQLHNGSPKDVLFEVPKKETQLPLPLGNPIPTSQD